MAKADYYEVLGVGRDADADTLKRAYRKLAMQHHPDRNPGDAEAEHKFKELNEAYDVLKDEQKRAAYDRFGHAAFEQGGGRGGGGGFGFDFAGSFADIFDDLFGEMTGRRGGAARGADIRFNLEVELEDVFFGKPVTIKVPTTLACEPCKGSGAADGAAPKACPSCRGAGKVRAQQGFFTIERTCPTCHGQGRVIDKPCRHCAGQGRVRREKSLQVQIPAGVDDGTRIRLAGEGEAGMRGAPPGDLYIFLAVRPHRLFQRDGQHLFCRVPIPMVAAALGGPIEVPTLAGKPAKVQVPGGTQTGKRFRVPREGMPVLRSSEKGDLIVEVMVETPVNLTKRQKELLEEFDKTGGAKNSPESTGFFARVKEFFDELK
ncbi:MAG: molecular chaperone DnaJ [Alphaproteobacteria bacterium]|nr:molecular chaperone DnaJ [Alphaproteobacteria bacterium]